MYPECNTETLSELRENADVSVTMLQLSLKHGRVAETSVFSLNSVSVLVLDSKNIDEYVTFLYIRSHSIGIRIDNILHDQTIEGCVIIGLHIHHRHYILVLVCLYKMIFVHYCNFYSSQVFVILMLF